jgi:hypothetical protein
MHFSADEIFQRGILSEVGNGCDNIPISVASVSQQYIVSELEAYANPALPAHGMDPSRRQESSWKPSRQQMGSEGSVWQGHTPCGNYPRNLTTHDIYRTCHQTPQSRFSLERAEAGRGTTFDVLVSPVSPTDDNHRYPTTSPLSPAVRISGQNTSSDSSISPMASNISTRDNSLSSSIRASHL